MSISRDKRLERAQMRVLFTVPFFAPGVARLPVIWDDTIETAATDGNKIRWSGKWFDSLPDAVIPTVLCHEVAHAMLGHLWRAPGGAEWEQWNIATDHAVNLMLKEFGAQVQAKRLADPFPFPDPQDAYCADPKFAGMAEEVIYNLLNSQNSGSGQPQGKPGQGKGAGKGQSTSPGNQNALGGQPSAISRPRKGSMPSFGQMDKPVGSQGPQNKKLQNDWSATLIQAVQMAQGRGDILGCIARFVDELVNPQVPWQEILRSWLREQCADDWDFLKPDLTMDESGFILPSLHSERVGPMVFATDTSGSINHELLAQFQGEKQNCLDDMRPSKLVDIYCDTKIQKVAEYSQGEVIGKDAPGGGGTSFVPVFEHLDKQPETPKALVYLTDLDGSFPLEGPGYPVIWLVWGTDAQAPFGQTIRIDSALTRSALSIMKRQGWIETHSNALWARK